MNTNDIIKLQELIAAFPDFELLTESERGKLHKLKQRLPTFGAEQAAAAERIRARIQNRQQAAGAGRSATKPVQVV